MSLTFTPSQTGGPALTAINERSAVMFLTKAPHVPTVGHKTNKAVRYMRRRRRLALQPVRSVAMSPSSPVGNTPLRHPIPPYRHSPGPTSSVALSVHQLCRTRLSILVDCPLLLLPLLPPERALRSQVRGISLTSSAGKSSELPRSTPIHECAVSGPSSPTSATSCGNTRECQATTVAYISGAVPWT